MNVKKTKQASPTQMLSLRVTQRSKFDKNLISKHVLEASLFVEQCKLKKESFLDVCGDRGDLYFLLRACLQEDARSPRLPAQTERSCFRYRGPEPPPLSPPPTTVTNDSDQRQ